MKMELHVHTQYSQAIVITDQYLLFAMSKLKKLRMHIAITDHNTTLGGRAFKVIFRSLHGIKGYYW